MKTYIGPNSISVTLGLVTVRRSVSNNRLYNQVELFMGQDAGTIVRKPTEVKGKSVLRYFIQTWENKKPSLEEITDPGTIADARAEFASGNVANMWAALEQQAKQNAPKFVESSNAPVAQNVGAKAEGQISAPVQAAAVQPF
jgi:hypothetical protein